MAERAARIRWSARHRRQVWWMEKIGAGVAAVLGLAIVVFTTDRFTQTIGVSVATLGVWGFFPSARPFISDMLDRLPLTANKTDGGPRIEG